jgi:hypothetical protein
MTMQRAFFTRLAPTLVVVAVLVSACSGGDGNGSEGANAGPAAPVPTPVVRGPEPGNLFGNPPGRVEIGGNLPRGPVTTSGEGTCDVKIGGDVTKSFTVKGDKATVGTDYWMADDELRDKLKALAKLANPHLSDDQVQRDVDRRMHSDPRQYSLVLNCTGNANAGEAAITLLPANASTYADVPFGPKTYTIPAGGVLGGGQKPGEFSVLFTLGDGIFNITESGTLKVTRFDKGTIAGTFSFKVTEAFSLGTPRTVTVVGTFEYKCSGSSVCKG